ncbi:MAG: hypothetical protein LBC79_07275 [Deltaproteobacteria bacterium]|jgi:hypothetical protein|nr:hypothetical protein [Deltaproteobacteria bacterium]
MDADMNLAALPNPQPGQAGRRKLVIMAAVALILLAGLAIWLASDEEAKDSLRTKTEDALHSAGLNSLVNATKELLAPPPPSPPVHSVGLAAPGVSANGTLIQGSTPLPADLAAAVSAQNTDATAAGPNEGATPELPPGVMPQQREDNVIRPDFVHDLANWLVMRYKPAPQGGKGQISAGLQSANLRYGVNMHGMERQAKDPAGARAHILRYAFNPSMLEALYGIYADRLVDDVARAALAPDQGRALNEAQLDDLYKTYAAFFADLAGAAGGIAAMPDLKGRIENINRTNQQTIALHRQITENVFALDEAREKKDDAGILGIQAKLDKLNGRYRAGLQEQNNARAALVSAIRSYGSAQRLDDESLLFLALWIERRMDKQADALDAVRKASALLADLSRRFEKAGGAQQKPAGKR